MPPPSAALRARAPQERAFWLVAVALIALGIAFRSVRYWSNPIALWADEASWARNLLQRPLTALEFRPIGLMAVTRWLMELTAVDERVLRLPSYLAGIAALFLALWVGRMLFVHRVTTLTLLGLVAISPLLVDFSREFKPYSVEVAVHLLLLGIGLGYWRTRSRRWLIALVVAAPLAFLLAYNAVFAYPVPFGLALLDRARARDRRGLAFATGGAAFCLAFVALLFATVISQIDAPDEAGFWGQKYGAFYVPATGSGSALEHARWALGKTVSIAALPGAPRDQWRPPPALGRSTIAAWSKADYWLWVALVAGGVASLLQRRRHAALGLLLGPLAVTFLFNLLGRWPWSAFRVNVFFLAYLLPLACVSIDALLGLRPRWVRGLAVATLLLVIGWPQIGFGWGLRTRKRAWVSHSELPAVLARLRAERERDLAVEPTRPRDLLLSDRYGCAPLAFYLDHHGRTSVGDGAFVRANFELSCIRGAPAIEQALAAARRPLWLVVSGPRSRKSLPKRVRAFADVLHEEEVAGTHPLLRLAPKKKKKR